MGKDQSPSGAEVTGAGGANEPEEIRADIEETRRQLGDTVEALAYKADVKARVKDTIAEKKSGASEKKDQALGAAKEVSPDQALAAASQVSSKARQNPLPLIAAGAFAAGFAAGRLTNR